MPIDLVPGVTVRVEPPVMPTVLAASAASSTVTVLPVVGPPGPAGTPGPTGPTGPGGGPYHRHEQTTPASVVTIAHNFGRWPAAITLTSLDGSVSFLVFGVEMIDLDTIRISIDEPAAYVALIS